MFVASAPEVLIRIYNPNLPQANFDVDRLFSLL